MGLTSLMKMKIADNHEFSGYVNTIEKSAKRAANLTSIERGLATAGRLVIFQDILRVLI